jgi:hypothetical protein
MAQNRRRLVRAHAQLNGTGAKPRRSPFMTQQTKNRAFDKQPKSDQKISPAGPHDKPELTDKDKTPGSGVMPDKDHKEVEGPTG